MTSDRFGKTYDRLFVALLTPMTAEYEIDEPGLRKLLRYFMQPKFIEAGGAVIINPEAGELFAMSREEKRRNVEIAMEECKGKVPIFAGVIDINTREAVKVAVDAKELGVDGIFIMPPVGCADIVTSWNPEKYPEVIIDLAKAEVGAVDLPAIVHPVGPSSAAWGIGLPVSTVVRMVTEVPNIVGWKMTYSYPGGITVAKALRSLPRHVGVLRATAKFFHENLATDYFDGTVSGSFNYAMEGMVDHISAWRQRDLEKACAIWKGGLADLHEYVYSDYSRLHVRYKAAAWVRGLISLPHMRPPMPKPSSEEIDTLRDLVAKAGYEAIPKSESDRVMASLHG